MSLGKEWSGTDWNSAGLCVNTDGRIWLDACGDSSSSTLSALSNDVSGQLLMQSLSSNVLLIADDANTLSASGSVLIAGANSVRIFSAHGTTGLFSGLTEVGVSLFTDPDSIGTDYFDRIEPSETSPDSNTALAYQDHCNEVSSGWSIAIIAQSAWTILMELGFALKGVVGPGGKACNLALTTQIAALVTWIALRTEILTDDGLELKFGESGPAGLEMYSLGAITWATPGFNSMHSLSGTVLTSGVGVGGLGLVSASLNAGINAVLKSPYRIGLDGKAAEVIGGTTVTLDAKKELNLMGLDVNVGAIGGEALTQVPTVSIEALSVKDLNVKSTGKVKQLAGGTAGYCAPTIEVLGNTHVTLKSPAYEIDISLSGIKIAILKTTKIEMTASGVSVDCMGGMALDVTDSVTIGSSSAFLDVDAMGSIVWQGALTTMM